MFESDADYAAFEQVLEEAVERTQTCLLARWPGWIEHVNGPQTEAELIALRRSVQRGSPLGEPAWSDHRVHRLGLESMLRPQGRPKKHPDRRGNGCRGRNGPFGPPPAQIRT